MRDNVTPFRPRKPSQKPSPRLNVNSPRGKAVLVQALTLAAFALNVVFPSPPLSYLVLAVAIAGVAVATSNRDQTMPWAATHHEHALRTLLFGYSITVLVRLIGMLLPRSMTSPDIMLLVVQIQVWTVFAVLVWAAIRSSVGIVLAILRKPIWHPHGLLL